MSGNEASVVIELGGKPFTLPTSPQDSHRRRAFFEAVQRTPELAEFRPPEGPTLLAPTEDRLTPQETAILDALGIDAELIRRFSTDLADFFDSLHMCSTDTAMMLKEECEKSYFIMWSILMHARDRLQKRMDDNAAEHRPASDLQIAHETAEIQSLVGLHTASSLTGEYIRAVYRLFTLQPTVKGPTQAEKTAIEHLFTVGYPGKVAAITRLFTVPRV